MEGKSPYKGDGLFLSFNYPQFVAWLNLPLALFPSAESAEPFWDMMNAIIVLFCVFLVTVGYRPENDKSEIEIKHLGDILYLPWWIIAFSAFFFYNPTTIGLRQGNISSWDLLFITLAGWTMIRRKEYAGGVFIALSSMIKILPVLLILPFIFAKRKKV